MKTLGELKSEVARRLGDSSYEIWGEAEIARYLNEGYERMSGVTGLLWGVTYLEDQAYAGSHTTLWETAYFPAGWLMLNRFHFTANWEADEAFADGMNYGPASHTTFWEYQYGYQTNTHFVAVHQMPTEVVEIERAVWNKHRIDPVRTTELLNADAQFQTQQGEVMGYLRDKDGPRSFRKWRVPASAADAWTITGTLGIARNLSDITGETVFGSWGIPRRIPGEHPCSSPWAEQSVKSVYGDAARGVPRRFYKDEKNTKIEYIKKGRTLSVDDDEFELPDVYVKYIRHFALYRALGRSGKGQDLEYSAFWKSLWDAGLARATARKGGLQKPVVRSLGASKPIGRPPVARLPWNYGARVR